jgi:hypothetical protein
MNRTIKLTVLLFIATSCCAQEPRQATLTQQKMCADQARKFFLDPEMAHEGWTSYTNHYDPKLNVCNVMVRIDVYLDKKHTEQFHSIALMVFDAFEGAQRAWVQSDVLGPNREPHVCEVEPIGHDKIYCKTEDEFETLVMKYFGTKRP